VTTEVLSQRAVELGLHEGDYVTRRILIDAARRLIMSVARVEEPSEEALEAYLRQHEEHFRSDDETRISHVLISKARHSSPMDDAADTLVQVLAEELSPDQAVTLADPGLVPPHLQLLRAIDLDRRFSAGFATRLSGLPEGEWCGPIPSRYGAHLVFIHKRVPGRVPELAQVRSRVVALVREANAERFLTERIRQLRSEYDLEAVR
jgi:hypothetical protein